MPIFIGDLSRKDAHILEKYALGSKRILEFGVGGSTQIFSMSPAERVISVDTSEEWIRAIKGVINEIGGVSPDFYLYDDLSRALQRGPFDLIFDDGIRSKRGDFGKLAWGHLRPNGVFILHDSRTIESIDSFQEIISLRILEIDRIDFHADDSNMLVIHKIDHPANYVNWNKQEKKPRWMFNALTERPANWLDILRKHGTI